MHATVKILYLSDKLKKCIKLKVCRLFLRGDRLLPLPSAPVKDQPRDPQDSQGQVRCPVCYSLSRWRMGMRWSPMGRGTSRGKRMASACSPLSGQSKRNLRNAKRHARRGITCTARASGAHGRLRGRHVRAVVCQRNTHGKALGACS
jgi:hypothetical protein